MPLCQRFNFGLEFEVIKLKFKKNGIRLYDFGPPYHGSQLVGQ